MLRYTSAHTALAYAFLPAVKRFRLRLFKGLSRPGPSASAAAPSLTHLGLEAVPLNGSVLAALTACTPQLLSLRLHGYDLHRKNGVAGPFVTVADGAASAAAAGAAGASGGSRRRGQSSNAGAAGVPALLRHGAPSLRELALQCTYNPDQLSQPLGLCSRLERFSMEWAISEWARRPSESEHAGFLSLLAGLPSLRSLELRLPPPPLGSHGLAPELELEPPDGSLRGLTCLKLIHAFPEMRPSLARWLGPRPQLVVLHLLPCVLDQSQLQVVGLVGRGFGRDHPGRSACGEGPDAVHAVDCCAAWREGRSVHAWGTMSWPVALLLTLLPMYIQISEVAGLTELVTCSLKVAPPAAQREGGGAAGSSAATSPAGPLLPSSLPLPPRLRRLGLWHVTAAVLNALALPPSLEQVHLHELRAIEYSQPAPGSDKVRGPQLRPCVVRGEQMPLSSLSSCLMMPISNLNTH